MRRLRISFAFAVVAFYFVSCKGQYCDESFLTHGVSTIAVCSYRHELVDCLNIRAGTLAHIYCAPGFTRPTWSPNSKQPTTLSCTEQHEWDYPKMRCKMKCGALRPKFPLFSKNGIDYNITEAPWHVNIYTKYGASPNYLAGGTILSPRIILTAAQPFWDKQNQQVLEAARFTIAAGKYFLEYDGEDEYFAVQKREVAQIMMQNYVGAADVFHNNLAVLLLAQPLQFSHSVSPICLQFGAENTIDEVKSHMVGYTARWHLADNGYSQILSKIPMNMLSPSDCRAELLRMRVFHDLSENQFCLTNSGQNVEALCRDDDIGHGFFVEECNRGEKYYRLLGVLSHGSNSLGPECVIAATNVNHFKNWLMHILAEEEEPVTRYGFELFELPLVGRQN